MKAMSRQRGRCRQASLFEQRAETPRMVHESETVVAIVDALADLLLEAARASRRARRAGGRDDEP